MLASEKRKLEAEQQKLDRMKAITECSFELFAEQGIESITMNEIARQAEIGVASLYRYFSTKEELVVETAVYAWNMETGIFQKYLNHKDGDFGNGFSKLKSLLEIFSEAYSTQSSFFRFIYYFDAFVKREKVSKSSLEKYENTISVIKDMVVRTIRAGRKDGSITFGNGKNVELKKSSDDELYFTIMHSLFSMSQKLSLSGDMLEMNVSVQPEKQISLMVEIILSALR